MVEDRFSRLADPLTLSKKSYRFPDPRGKRDKTLSSTGVSTSFQCVTSEVLTHGEQAVSTEPRWVPSSLRESYYITPTRRYRDRVVHCGINVFIHSPF